MGYDDTRDRGPFEDWAPCRSSPPYHRLRWRISQTFKYQKIFVSTPLMKRDGAYPHGWDVWSNGIKAFMAEKGNAAPS